MLRGETMTRIPPPSCAASLFWMRLDAITMRFTPTASRQPPDVAVLSSHIMFVVMNAELVRTAMAPPLEEAELLRNVHDVAVSMDDSSTYSAPPLSPFEIAQFSNVEEERIATTPSNWSPRVPVCDEKCNEVKVTDSVREEPVIDTAA